MNSCSMNVQLHVNMGDAMANVFGAHVVQYVTHELCFKKYIQTIKTKHNIVVNKMM